MCAASTISERISLLVLGLLLPIAQACAARPLSADDPKAKASSQASVNSEELPTVIVTPDEALDVASLLERAGVHLAARRYSEAQADYRLVASETRNFEHRLKALRGWGTALDLGAQPEEALRIYSTYVKEASQGDRRDIIVVRIVRLLVYLERYPGAYKYVSSIELPERRPLEQVILYAARALYFLDDSRFAEAERALVRGRFVIDSHSLDRVRIPALDVAAFFFALGELRARRASLLVFEGLPEDFPARLEERCQLILDSQAAFSDAMRSEDAHWSSMSGVRVAGLYQSLHRDLMKMKRPSAVDTKRREELFEGAIRLRYSILLRKSLSMLRATVALLDRSDKKSPWRKRAREALQEIEEAQEREELAIEALPYTRAQLQSALDDLEARAKSQSSQAGS